MWKYFQIPPKIWKLRTQKIFYCTSSSQKGRTQSGYPSWKMFNNNSSFHDGNWLSIRRVSRLPLTLHHLSNSWISYFFAYGVLDYTTPFTFFRWSFMWFANNSNLFSCLEIIDIFNFRTNARIQNFICSKISCLKIFGFMVCPFFARSTFICRVFNTHLPCFHCPLCVRSSLVQCSFSMCSAFILL